MGKPIDITLDDDVYQGLVRYLEQEFGNTRAKSLIVNIAVRDFLQKKGIMPNPERKSRTNPGQGSLL